MGSALSVIAAHLLLTLTALWLLPMAGWTTRQLPPPTPYLPPLFAGPPRCYRLTFTPGEFARTIPMDRGQGLPEVLRVTGKMLDGATDWPRRQAYSAPAVRVDVGPVWWVVAGPDSVDVVIPTLNAAVGIHIRLPSTGDTLVGRAWPYLDTPSDGWSPDATVVAVPVECSGPVRIGPPREMRVSRVGLFALI